MLVEQDNKNAEELKIINCYQLSGAVAIGRNHRKVGGRVELNKLSNSYCYRLNSITICAGVSDISIVFVKYILLNIQRKRYFNLYKSGDYFIYTLIYARTIVILGLHRFGS